MYSGLICDVQFVQFTTFGITSSLIARYQNTGEIQSQSLTSSRQICSGDASNIFGLFKNERADLLQIRPET